MSPGFLSDGWFNGDPKQMIKYGTYEKHRDAMKGLKYTDEQIAAFDAEWELGAPARKVSADAREKSRKHNEEEAAIAQRMREKAREEVLAERKKAEKEEVDEGDGDMEDDKPVKSGKKGK